ncbi:MAG: hypothetical protein ACYC56_11955 [Candidatus Aquicultor sp.]
MKPEKIKDPGELFNVTAAGMGKNFAGFVLADFKFVSVVFKTMPGG